MSGAWFPALTAAAAAAGLVSKGHSLVWGLALVGPSMAGVRLECVPAAEIITGEWGLFCFVALWCVLVTFLASKARSVATVASRSRRSPDRSLSG